MKNVASALVAGAGVFVFFEWSQIIFRLRLFFANYHGQRGVNHIGDGDFALIYFANVLLLTVVAFGLVILWRHSRAWRITSLTVAAMNVLAWVAYFIMHRTGALVEYGEFIRHWRGEI